MRLSAPAIVRSFTPVFLWMILLYALSSIPGDVDNDFAPPSAIAWVPPALQNALHLPAYGVLAWLWFRALNAHGWRPAAALCAAFAFASIFFLFSVAIYIFPCFLLKSLIISTTRVNIYM